MLNILKAAYCVVEEKKDVKLQKRLLQRRLFQYNNAANLFLRALKEL